MSKLKKKKKSSASAPQTESGDHQESDTRVTRTTVETVKGEKVSSSSLVPAASPQVRSVSIHAGRGSFLEPTAEVRAVARRLVNDGKRDIAQGLGRVDAHGQASVRYTLDNEEEVAAARVLENEGYGVLTCEGTKTGKTVCIVHGKEFPCIMGEGEPDEYHGGNGGKNEKTAIARRQEGLSRQCNFRQDGEPEEWVFEFTGPGGGGGDGMGGVLGKRDHDR